MHYYKHVEKYANESKTVYNSFSSDAFLVVMAALCNREALYFCPVVSFFFYLLSSSSSFFSSPNLSGHRLDVYHTSTHGVVIVSTKFEVDTTNRCLVIALLLLIRYVTL